MKTFLEFLKEETLIEANHAEGGRVHDWGVIHPKTGSLISGQQHPTATTHRILKSNLFKNDRRIPTSHYADYVHYTHTSQGTKDAPGLSSHLVTQVRSSNKTQHQALQKGLKHLPVAHSYEHGTHDASNKEHFTEFNNAKDLHKHVNDLAK